MRSQFSASVRWNIIEVLLYQGGLMLHHSFLFRLLASADYGAIGTTFSTLYLVSHIVNAGLDVVQDSFFSSFSRSKADYKRFLSSHVIPTYGTLLALIPILTLVVWLFSAPYKPLFVLMLLSLIFVETLKRTAKNMAKLLFKNKLCAHIETISLIGYLALTWGQYHKGLPLTVTATLWPLMIASVASLAAYLYIIYAWYQLLPNHPLTTVCTNPTRTDRLIGWGYQGSKQVSSSNFLIAYLGLFIGLEHAGIMSMLCTLLYSINNIVQHSVGSSLLSLLVRSRDHARSLHFLTSSSITPLVILFTFLWTIPILYNSAAYSPSLLLICAALACIEYLWVHHEKLFIAKNRTGSLIMATLLLPLIIPFASSYYSLQTPQALFTFFVGIRLASCSYLSYSAHLRWGVRMPHVLIATSVFLLLLTVTFG